VVTEVVVFSLPVAVVVVLYLVPLLQPVAVVVVAMALLLVQAAALVAAALDLIPVGQATRQALRRLKEIMEETELPEPLVEAEVALLLLEAREFNFRVLGVMEAVERHRQ
jgi:hypothetical protein